MPSTSRPALLCAAVLALGVTLAHAQAPSPRPLPGRDHWPAVAPVIESVQVLADAALQPGSSLQFTVRGTPGGQARVLLPGGSADVALSETSRGVYTGNYTVRRADSIDPMGSVRSSLTVGPATSVTHSWFPAPIRDSLALASPVVPQTAIASQPLPPLAAAQPQPAVRSSERLAIARVIPLPSPALRPPPDDTRAMGAQTAPPSPLTLEVLSPGSPASVDIGQVVVRGRTQPGAQVRVQVEAVPQAKNGMAVVAQPVLLQTVRADAQGEFSFTIGPQRAPPGMRYDVLLRASDGTRSTPEQRLVLIHRG